MRTTLISILILLSGCASQVVQLTADLESQPSCCATLADLPFSSLGSENEVRFPIGPGDRVFNFPSGKSYVKAFELPRDDRFAGLEVRTYLVGEWIPTAHAFGPFFQFLDGEKVPIEAEVSPQLYYDEGFFEGSRWTGVVKIPLAARYFVIFTKPELVKFQRIPLAGTSGYAYSAGSSFVYVPPSGARSSSYGPAGELRLRLVR